MNGLALRGPQLIGLDIGTTAVKAARIRRKGSRFVVTGLARAVLDHPGQEAAAAGEKTSLAIWRCLHMLHEARGSPVVCGLSGPDVAVRTFEFPPLPAKQLASAVELEAAQVCPFDVAQSAVAYQVLQGGPPKGGLLGLLKKEQPQPSVGIFAAARNSVVQEVQDLCKRAATHCAMVDVAGLALLNCLQGCGARNEGKGSPTRDWVPKRDESRLGDPSALGGPETALVLNVGSTYTNVAILSDDGRPFVRDIPYAGEGILGHISQATGRPKQAIAEALASNNDAEPAPADLEPAVRKACALLADRVIETMRYYGTQKSSPAVDRILLCGGLAQAKAVAGALISQLTGKVELWDPLSLLPCTRSVHKGPLAGQGPAFAVALGLAMRSA